MSGLLPATECASGPRPSPGCTEEEAEGPDRVRKARETACRFMTAVAADLPAYEEATRRLIAVDWTAFEAAVAGRPEQARPDAVRPDVAEWGG